MSVVHSDGMQLIAQARCRRKCGYAMNASNLVRRLHQHRIWSNQGLLAAARHLTATQLRQPLPIGQGSVWKTLTHLLAAEYVWLEALLGNENPLLRGDVPGQLPGNQQGEDTFASLDELALHWHELDCRWLDYLASLTDAKLDTIIYKKSTSSGVRRGTKCADVLLHVCTHGHYTTAQLVNMLRQLGADELPDLMLITLARQEQDQGT